MIYDLPTSVEINGVTYKVQSDYRAILDICVALNDPELSQREKVIVLLDIFYHDSDTIPPEDYQEAVKKCFWFISCGNQEPDKKMPHLVDWSKDFPIIVAPINRVIGKDVRSFEYLHWWTFVSYYLEIGNCLFAQVVRIRSLKAKGKPLDKADREFYRENRELIDLKTQYTDKEREVVELWTKGKTAPETGTV